MKRAVAGAAAALITLLFVGANTAHADSAEKCAAAKARAAGKKAAASAGCLARSYVNPDFDVDTCLDNASIAFETAFDRAEAVAANNGGCATVGDVDAVEFDVDDFVDTIDTDVAPY